ncbi:GNAT family N-acetyltransferase [Novosphingobium sp. KN65.2]|uniref:GNAT family N-acetyltransferase n=1 Tax=Novosphingobium sp. KN65.2 TaxID=1478134 RepID=UPI0005E8C9C5|nr:GNAT family N-acetyltransferase [Novosphingobium sp. KN65.2]CDO34902.1 GCN5-related N-acetyltransferase [Novosphingobium sp. KN65.2]
MNGSTPDSSTPAPPECEVVPLTPEHLPQALALSQALEWPYRLEDWEIALRLGRGFAVERDGECIGTALWWPYDPDYASAGMIIVAEKAQRQGIGARLMDALLADTAGRTMILNSTAEGQVLYRRVGFEPYDIVHQHQAVLIEAPAIDASVPLRPATSLDRDALMALDRAGSGMGRDNLVGTLSEGGDVLVVARKAGLTGYAIVRRWGRGVVIGPVIAHDATDAKALIAALAARHVGTFVRIDVTESCKLSPWLETLGLPQVGRVVSMSRGKPPQAKPGTTLFALSNQSLG